VRWQPTGLWRNDAFRKLWAAETISVFGSLVSRTALSFTAILALRATPFQLGLLATADLLPGFLIGLLAGVWVDRLRRRPIMIAADLGRALLLGTIPLAAVLGVLRIEQLYAVALLTGVLTLFFDVANRAYLPALVAPEALVEGNSALTASASVAEFGAFAIAGWLVQWLSGPLAVLIDAVSFLVSALCLAAIRAPESPPTVEERQSVRTEVAEGLRAVLHHPLLRALTAATALLGVSGGVIGTVIVAFMVRDLGFRPGVLGMIFAVGGLSSLLGALAVGPVTRRLGVGRTLVGSLVFAALGVLLVPCAQGPGWLSGTLLVGSQLVTDPAQTVYEINQVSLRQRVAPARMLGRVNAALEMAGLGAALAGSLAGGVLGGRIGLRATLVAGACGTLLAALWLGLSPALRTLKAEPIPRPGVGA
jgi:MFS family permease